MVDQFGAVTGPVVQDDRDVLLRIEHVTPDGQHVALGRDQNATLVSLQALQAAGTVDLDDLRLHAVDDLRERRRYRRRRLRAQRQPE